MTSGLGIISSIQNTPSRVAFSVFDPRRDLRAELGRVRRARAQHELGVGRELLDRLQQVHDALLARDPADEHDRRLRRVDAVLLEHVGVRVRLVLVGVDPVVDHVHAIGVDVRIHAQDVALGPVGHRDHGVRVLERRLLGVGRQRGSRRRAAPPSTAAAAPASAPWRRAGCPTRAWPGARRTARTTCACARCRRPARPRPSSGRSTASATRPAPARRPTARPRPCAARRRRPSRAR